MSIKPINSVKKFKAFTQKIQKGKGYREPLGFGIARVDRGQLNHDKILQATYPVINWKDNYASAAAFVGALKESGVGVDFSKSEFVYDVKKKFVKNAFNIFYPYLKDALGNNHKNVQVVKNLYQISQSEGLEDNFRIVFIFDDEAPKSVESAYLKLYALSLGKAKLRSLNLTGIFGLLENVAWSLNVPVELEWLRENEIELKLDGAYPYISSVDKFPRFLQHVIPTDKVRILDASKVRMGAQLADGTAVMPGASYVNFNSGTTGAVMVEGRISSSVIVGEGSDIGGGASILGVLSGTNGNPVAIGKNTLLGANSVTGIPLGDGCIVDAGVSVLEGTKVFIEKEHLKAILEINPDFNFKYNQNSDVKGYVIKAIELSSLNGIHFRRDSQTGKMLAVRSNRKVVLNADLH
ncbi:MAG: tetrahydrodipicolinate N-succinyltransferase N-terminal domain-containing protein [Campylobacteraceae bacterium]|jgi:2,3,4,5-tetrahydropyridine-2-carboxylate N-succinyltransferase|nr:tetrahydrodipicolinate N-succinyltransferase N-terminal domain-containing protein [Campylobacteraceae bacterium]